MAARLIINADDFGLTPGVNRAIAELHQARVLTSATLMATGPAFDDAVAVARANPTLGVGCHIVLTDGVPVSAPEEHPHPHRSGRQNLPSLPHRLPPGSPPRQHQRRRNHREAAAQIQKLQLAGIHITHLDTHKHTHLFPAVARPLLGLAERHNIGAIRQPFEQPWSLALGHGNRTRRILVRVLARLKTSFERQPQIRNGRVQTTDGTIGISATGSLYGETLREILNAMPAEGTFELVCHPGYNDRDLDRITTRLRAHRDVERNALLTELPRAALNPNAPQLINYGNLRASESGHLAPDTGYESVL